MKHLIFAVLVTTILFPAITAAETVPGHLWSQRFGVEPGADFALAVAVDGLGDVYMVGSFHEMIDFGGGDLVSAGSADVFLAKFAANGTHLWSQRFGDTGEDIGYAIAVDGSGSVIVAGVFAGTINLGGSDLVGVGVQDIFLAKFASNGTHLWSRSFGGLFVYASAVAVDASDNVFMLGYFSGGVANLGGSNLTAINAASEVFLAKYDANGMHLWSQSRGGLLDDFGVGLAVDGTGNVFATGVFSLTANFGGGDLTTAGDEDIFLAKYDANGAHLWSQGFGGPIEDRGYSVAVDASGCVFATGYFQVTADFGGGALVSAGGYTGYLAKFDPNGAHLWSRQFGGTDMSTGAQSYSVAANASGGVFATGAFVGTADFGGGNLVSTGISGDAFLVEYDGSGAHQWSRRFGGQISAMGQDVAMDGAGNIILVGNLSGAVDFGGGYLIGSETGTDYGNPDTFVAKYASLPIDPTITSIADVGNDQGRMVSVRFNRSGHDQTASATPVTRYEVYRRDDAPPASSTGWRNVAGLSNHKLLADGWTQVGSVDAHQETTYGIVVPTLGDSTTALGQYYSVFYVRGATAATGMFFDSPPDSGYSVDNLAPGVPGGLLYNSGLLSWSESRDEDFDYFTVYGSNTDTFSAATVVDYSVAPTLDVTSAGYIYYFVTATDFSGNEGKAAKINTLSGVGGTPKSYVLSVTNFPNPFNPRTTVSYTVPSRGNVTVAIYDARGARVATLVDNEPYETGAYRMDWNGRTTDGVALASGIYFARIEHGGDIHTRKMVLLK